MAALELPIGERLAICAGLRLSGPRRAAPEAMIATGMVIMGRDIRLTGKISSAPSLSSESRDPRGEVEEFLSTIRAA